MENKISPGQAGQIQPGLRRSTGIGTMGSSKKTGRDIIHIGNGMLKAGQNEQENRQIQAGQLFRHRRAGKADPHGNTDEKVTKYAQYDRTYRGQGRLSQGGLDRKQGQAVGKKRELLALAHKESHDNGAYKIANIDKKPAF